MTLKTRVGNEKKITFRNKELNFEIFFENAWKKYRMFEKISKKKNQLRSWNCFKIKNFWGTILILGQIYYGEFKKHGPETA